MWRLIDLKKGAFLNVNGEMFEVVGKNSIVTSPTSNELELTLELNKLGDKSATPSYRLVYTEKSEEVRFEQFDRKEGIWKGQKITKLGF